jgi:hypothetical protein
LIETRVDLLDKIKVKLQGSKTSGTCKLAHLTRFSEKFESTQMGPYLFFYDFCNLTDLRKLTVRFI